MRAFKDMVNSSRNQEALVETPPSVPEDLAPDVERARRSVEQALADGRSCLSAVETAEVLEAFDIPIVATRIARDPDDATSLADAIDGPVTLKLVSPDLVHKTDIGGVALDLSSPEMVAAAQAMLDRVRAQHPDARLDGLAVQPMVERPDAFELIVGAIEDPSFGPVIVFGQGGTAVELLADHDGVIVLDTRIRVAPTTAEPTARLAIRPYPSELEELIRLGDGRALLLRPIAPEDKPSLQATFARLTPEEIRLRFFAPMKTLTHMAAARFTRLDYDREMALILTESGRPATTEIYGVVRISADPDLSEAEYAVIVHHDMTGLGLGPLLMRRIIDYVRSRGIEGIWDDVLIENATMRKLCRVLGSRSSTSRAIRP